MASLSFQFSVAIASTLCSMCSGVCGRPYPDLFGKGGGKFGKDVCLLVSLCDILVSLDWTQRVCHPKFQLFSLTLLFAGDYLMDQPMREFTDLMLTRGVISLDQLSEAKLISKKEDKQVGQILVRLGYASGEEVTQAIAEFYKFEYVDLATIRIPDHVIQLVPESVARENKIIPVSDEDETIKVLVSRPV